MCLLLNFLNKKAKDLASKDVLKTLGLNKCY